MQRRQGTDASDDPSIPGRRFPSPSRLGGFPVVEPNEQPAPDGHDNSGNLGYLIVLDNICDISVWETVKSAFIGNDQGSGLIATTYKLDVAESIGGVYRLPLLSNEDSKKLFYRRTYFGIEDRCPSEYRELSKTILNKCSQLPLAIIDITNLLPTKLKSEEEWKRVCNSIGSGSERRLKDMRRTLSRGYHDLPNEHLKKCFLYLCIFPEDYVIRRDSLVQRWLSEDLIHGNDGQNLQELGEKYFNELLGTGMIQPIEHDSDGNALSCRVPGVMIDVIASLLSEEKCSLEKETEKKSALEKETEEKQPLKREIKEKHATTQVGHQQTNLHEVKRLSLQVFEQNAGAKETKILDAAAVAISSSVEEKKLSNGTVFGPCFCNKLGQLFSTNSEQQQLSTLSRGRFERKLWQGSLSISCSSADLMDGLQNYKNLCELVLEGPLENGHIITKNLGSLRQLRRLVLATPQITAIPQNVCKLRFLETLDLRETLVHELPCAFVGLKQLRCLLINRSTKVPSGISNLQALEQIQDINITPDILEGICALPELRFLRMALASWDENSSKPLPNILCKLRTTKLKHLSICSSCSLEFKPDDIQKVLQNIEKLEIQHNTFGTLPTWIDGKLEKLSSLSIEVYSLKMKALETLASLPALHFLSLTVKGVPEEMPTAKTTAEAGRAKRALEENPTAKKTTEEGKSNAKRVPEKGPTTQRAPEENPTAKKTTEEIRSNAKMTPEKGPTAQSALEEKVDTATLVAPEGFGKLKTFHLSSRAIGIKFQKRSMENLERLKLSFWASHTKGDFSFGLDNLSSLKLVQVEIICFSATKKEVHKAEDAFRSMIWGSPKQPRPTLDIRRSSQEYIVKDKRELRDSFFASLKGQTAYVQKEKEKERNA